VRHWFPCSNALPFSTSRKQSTVLFPKCLWPARPSTLLSKCQVSLSPNNACWPKYETGYLPFIACVSTITLLTANRLKYRDKLLPSVFGAVFCHSSRHQRHAIHIVFNTYRPVVQTISTSEEANTWELATMQEWKGWLQRSTNTFQITSLSFWTSH
jgi:hypothetical protein